MGDYYNKTRGPLSVTLNDGSAASVSPKTWLYVTPANEGSPTIVKLVEKGFLVRSKVALTAELVAAPVVAAPVAPVAVAVQVVPVVPAPLLEKSEDHPVSSKFGGKSR